MKNILGEIDQYELLQTWIKATFEINIRRLALKGFVIFHPFEAG